MQVEGPDVQLDALQDWPLLPLLGGTLLPLRHRRLVFVLPLAAPPAGQQGTGKADPAPAPGGQLQPLNVVDAVAAPLPSLHDLVGSNTFLPTRSCAIHPSLLTGAYRRTNRRTAPGGGGGSTVLDRGLSS